MDQVRKALSSDVTKMVSLSHDKRRMYEKVQPQFWRYAHGAEKAQADWFQELLLNDDYVLLVAETKSSLSGFIIGNIIKAPEVYDPGGLTLMIDDFCVVSEDEWNTVGTSLVEYLKNEVKDRGVSQVLVVCGAHDTKKKEFLGQSGLSIASEWFVAPV